MHSKHEISWYATLEGSYSIEGFKMTRVGRNFTHLLVNFLEMVKIAPKGTIAISSILNSTALDLVEGGKHDIFTPGYLFVARKKSSTK